MMITRKVLIALSLPLLLSATLSSCATTQIAPVSQVHITSEPLKKIVPKQAHPRPLQLSKAKFYVVTEKNFDDFKKKFLIDNKEFVFYAVSPTDYKKIVGNQAEMLRYVKQSNAIIVYYESNLN